MLPIGQIGKLLKGKPLLQQLDLDQIRNSHNTATGNAAVPVTCKKVNV